MLSDTVEYIKHGISVCNAVVGRSLNINSILYPLTFSYIVTKKCNLKCSMCDIWKRKTDINELSLEDIEGISKSRYLRKVMFLGLSGGEPFLRKDIVDIVDVFSQRMRLKEIRFSTNGTMSDKIEEDITRILDRTDAGVDVTISLDGVGKAHDSVRGVDGCFERITKTIDALKEIQKGNDRLDIGVRFTILPENYQELMSVYKFSRERCLNFTCKPAVAGGYFENLGESYDFNLKEKKEVIDIVDRIIKSEQEKLDLKEKKGLFMKIKAVSGILFLKYLIDYINNPRKTVFPCYACFSSVFLENDGGVYTCPILYKKIGDITETSFDDVWTSNEMKKMRKFIKKGVCSCYTNCNQIPSLVLSGMPSILAYILREEFR